MSFLKSFQNKSAYSNYPFDHWELTEPLTDGQIKEICEAKVPEIKIDFDGTRCLGFPFLEEVFGGIIRKYPRKRDFFIDYQFGNVLEY